MCGLVGVMGTPGKELHDIFETLLSIGIVRGVDSTGVAAIHKENVTIIKDTVFPLELIRSREYQSKIRKKKNEIYCLIGHNRSATIGDVNSENSHPFEHEHIILAHNGTLVKDFKVNNRKFETDSEGLTYSIAKRGIRKTWAELDGAAALLYFDLHQQSLNLITNGKRPIKFVMLEDKKYLLVASEHWMLSLLSQHMNLSLVNNTILYPKDDILFSFKRNPETGDIKDKAKKLEPKPPFNYLYGKRVKGSIWPLKSGHERQEDLGYSEADYEGFGFGQGDDDDDAKTDINIVKLQEKNITEEEFYKTYKQCSLCLDSLEGEYLDAVVVDKDIAVCESCVIISEKNNLDLATLRGQGI